MSVWYSLQLDVLADDADGRSAAGGCEVAGRPESAPPVALADVRALLAQQATGNTLQAVHERGNSQLRRILHVHVVVFAVHFHERRLRVRADLGEDATQDVDRTRIEHTATILCYEDPNAHVAGKHSVCHAEYCFHCS